MDLYNIVTKIPYVLMLGIGLVIVLQLYVGGLQDIETNVETVSEEEYRRAILLEKLVNYDADLGDIDYDYDRRRAVMPKEIFTNENPEDDEIGHRKRGLHCYIEEIEGLDGQNFAFGVNLVDSPARYASNPEPILCQRPTSNVKVGAYVSTPVQIVRGENPPLEARVYVYQVG
jgi:hypothetical protein